MKYRYITSPKGEIVRSARIYTPQEHQLSKDLIRWEAVQVIQQLVKRNFEAYVVGGSVRDLLLGNTPKDFDVVTSASPERISSLFREAHIIGRRFLLVHVLFGNIHVEVATFRATLSHSNAQRWGDIHEDVYRRDFTVNSLYYSPIENTILDFVNAMDDIEGRILRPLIPLSTIFVEDPVRLIRAVKYSKSLNLSYAGKLKKKILQSGHLLQHISESRLTEEFIKILASPVFAQIFMEMYETGLLTYLLPNIDEFLRKDTGAYESWARDLMECEQYFLNQSSDQGDWVAAHKKNIKSQSIRNGRIIYILCKPMLFEMKGSKRRIEQSIIRLRIKTLLEPLIPPNTFISKAMQLFAQREH